MMEVLDNNYEMFKWHKFEVKAKALRFLDFFYTFRLICANMDVGGFWSSMETIYGKSRPFYLVPYRFHNHMMII